MPGNLTSLSAYDAAMRKPDPERIYLARRAAILSILTGSGTPADRAEAQVVAWKAAVTARELSRHAAMNRDSAVYWIAQRRRA